MNNVLHFVLLHCAAARSPPALSDDCCTPEFSAARGVYRRLHSHVNLTARNIVLLTSSSHTGSIQSDTIIKQPKRGQRSNARTKSETIQRKQNRGDENNNRNKRTILHARMQSTNHSTYLQPSSPPLLTDYQPAAPLSLFCLSRCCQWKQLRCRRRCDGCRTGCRIGH